MINRIENSRTVQTWILDPSMSFGVGETWNLEAGAVDDVLSLKVWRLEDSEPEVPQFVVSDSGFDEGRFGVESNIHVDPFGGPARVSAVFDNIYFTFPGEKGDFDHDDDLDIDDLNVLIRQINGDGSIYVDLTEDGLVDGEDLNTWIKTLFRTWIGDANLDGEFNSVDLIDALAAGTYETDSDAIWSSGDFDGDARFNSGDLIIALADGGYEQGPRAAVAAVPEPPSAVFLVVGSVVVLMRRCRFA